jgi:hypothetical protein
VISTRARNERGSWPRGSRRRRDSPSASSANARDVIGEAMAAPDSDELSPRNTSYHSMPRASQETDRDPEKPPRRASGAGPPDGFTLIERLVARVVNIDVDSAESTDQPGRDSSVPRDPDKPAPEESGAWNKRGFRSVDRIVNWIVTGDPDMPWLWCRTGPRSLCHSKRGVAGERFHAWAREGWIWPRRSERRGER